MKRHPTNGKLCPVPGCGAMLLKGNNSGVCRNHQHRKGFCTCRRCLGQVGKPPVPPSPYLGQIMAECDCNRQAECVAAGECLAAKAKEEPQKDDSWKGEHLLRGIKAPRGEGNGYNIGKTKWRRG